MFSIGRNSIRLAKTSTLQEKLIALQNRISDVEANAVQDADIVESRSYYETLGVIDGDDGVSVFTDFGYYFALETITGSVDYTTSVSFPSAIESFIQEGGYVYATKYGEFTIQTINNMLVCSDIIDNFLQIKGLSGRVYDMQKSHVENGLSFYRVRNFSTSDVDDIPTGMIEVKSYTKVDVIATDRLSIEMLTKMDMIGVSELRFYGNVLKD